MEMNQEMEKGKVCNCSHHKVVPILIIVISLVVLYGGFYSISFQSESMIVGILALAIGVTKLFGRNCGCCK